MIVTTEDVITIAKSVLVSMLGIDLQPADQPSNPVVEQINGCVQISGAWQGAVLLQTSTEFASRAACRMLQTEPHELTEADIKDVIAEITNMIGGNIKSLVPGPSFLSLPTVTTGHDFDFRVFGAKLISDTMLASDDEPLRILVCEQDLECVSPVSSRNGHCVVTMRTV